MATPIDNNSEVIAYLHQYITKEIHKDIKAYQVNDVVREPLT
jgi:hypothetical protein